MLTWVNNIIIHFVEGHPSFSNLITFVKLFMAAIDHQAPPFILRAIFENMKVCRPVYVTTFTSEETNNNNRHV